MAVILQITAGWTKEIGPFTLRNNGLPILIPPGATVRLKLKSSTSSNFVDTEGDVRIGDDQDGPGKGQVYFTPDEMDFVAKTSPFTVYQAKWEYVDAGGRVFFPNGAPDTIEVYPA